ncbi:MAG TPA: hypothetical protein V6C78_15305 [Crinalium sp.]
MGRCASSHQEFYPCAQLHLCPYCHPEIALVILETVAIAPGTQDEQATQQD